MGKSGVATSNPGTPQSWNRYAYVQNNPLEFTDPTGMDCVYNNEDGYVEVKYGDCWSGTDNGYYIDCDGCAYNAAGATVDQATGDLYFTDSNGNPIDGTLISEFADPVGTSTTIVVTPTGSWSLPPGSIWVPHPDPSPSNGSGGGYATAHAPNNGPQKSGFISCTFTGKVGMSYLSTALDGVGIVPGAGNVLHGVQFGGDSLRQVFPCLEAPLTPVCLQRAWASAWQKSRRLISRCMGLS